MSEIKDEMSGIPEAQEPLLLSNKAWRELCGASASRAELAVGRRLMPHERKELDIAEPEQHDGSEAPPFHSSMEDEAIKNLKDKYAEVRMHLHEMDLVHSEIAADVMLRITKELFDHCSDEYAIFEFDTSDRKGGKFIWGCPGNQHMGGGLCLCIRLDNAEGTLWPIMSVPSPVHEED